MLGVHNRDLAHFYCRIRDSEINSTKLLGCKMQVLAKEPIFKLEVTVASPNYDGKNEGAACVIIFYCPRHYPARMPTIKVHKTYNFPRGYQNRMYDEFERILCYNVAMQLIMPITTKAQAMVNDLELPHYDREYK